MEALLYSLSNRV